MITKDLVDDPFFPSISSQVPTRARDSRCMKLSSERYQAIRGA
jgi:hypothetical protein